MKKTSKADILLICSLLIASAILLLAQVLTREDGLYAAVYVDGVKTAAYPLKDDIDVVLDHPGGGYNRLVIENGEARVTGADCPDRICVKSHAIRYTGESITCLPNRTRIIIEGGERKVDM